MKTPRILIAGNMGYVGPGVVRRLRRAFPEAELIGYDLGLFAQCVTLPESTGGPEAVLDRQVLGDIRDLPAGLLDGVDAVVNMAAISNDPMGNAYEAVTGAVNHRAGIALARAARAAGVGTFVFASSCSVYGQGDATPRTEAAALAPLTAYARSKVASEVDLQRLAGPGFRVTCLRFATACGWSDRLRLDLVLNDFVATALATGAVQVLSDGSPWRPLIHVQDMARAIEWAIGRPAAAGGNFLAINAGADDWNFQVRELAAAVAAALPGTTVSLNPAAAPDRRSYRVDFGLFRQLAPAHQPLRTLPDTIAELSTGLRALGAHRPGFDRARLIRLNTLAALRQEQLLTEELTWDKELVGG